VQILNLSRTLLVKGETMLNRWSVVTDLEHVLFAGA